MSHNLLTFILLATILVEASCFPNRPQGNLVELNQEVDEIRNLLSLMLAGNSSSGTCIIPKLTTGVRIVRFSCGRSCNSNNNPGRRVPSGTSFSYNCRDGYIMMRGSGMSVCSDGVWDEIPKCWKTCDALVSDSVDIVCRLSGEVLPCQPHAPPGTVASLRCTWPYLYPFTEGDGYREITCLRNGTWDRSLIMCSWGPR